MTLTVGSRLGHYDVTAPPRLLSERRKYFAYGSNLCSRRLRQRTPSASVKAVGVLRAHVLRFHKVGFRDGSGKCDAFATGIATDVTWGAVFELDSCEKAWLDDVEGLGRGYVERLVRVETALGLIWATTYVASPDAIRSDIKPYSWYKNFVLAGATEHGFSRECVDAIRAVAAVEDPNVARTVENMPHLTGEIR